MELRYIIYISYAVIMCEIVTAHHEFYKQLLQGVLFRPDSIESVDSNMALSNVFNLQYAAAA